MFGLLWLGGRCSFVLVESFCVPDQIAIKSPCVPILFGMNIAVSLGVVKPQRWINAP